MPLLKKTAFGLILAFAAGLAAAAGNTQIESFNQAKKTLEREVYQDHRITFYCQAPFDSRKNITLPAGFTTPKHEKRASISFVQRHLGIGYNRAANLLEAMESAGLVSKPSSMGKRTILVPDRNCFFWLYRGFDGKARLTMPRFFMSWSLGWVMGSEGLSRRA